MRCYEIKVDESMGLHSIMMRVSWFKEMHFEVKVMSGED